MEFIGYTADRIRTWRDENGKHWYLFDDIRTVVHKPRLKPSGERAYVVIEFGAYQDRRYRLVTGDALLDVMEQYDYEHPHKFWRDAIA